MTEQALEGPEIAAAIEHMDGEGISQALGIDAGVDARFLGRGPQRAL